MSVGILPNTQCPSGNIYSKIIGILQLYVLLIQVTTGRIGINSTEVDNRTDRLGIGYFIGPGSQAVE
jgi:hypothetical protein